MVFGLRVGRLARRSSKDLFAWIPRIAFVYRACAWLRSLGETGCPRCSRSAKEFISESNACLAADISRS